MAKTDRKKSGNKVAKLSAPMKKAIDALIHVKAEDKYVTAYQPTYPLAQTYTANINSAADFKIILPNILQGSAMTQRIGNKITPKSLVVNFTLTMTGSPTTNSSDLFWGRLMVLTHKTIKNPGLASAIDPASLLLVDGENTTSYKGLPGDENWRINRRNFTVVSDKRLKFQRGFGTLPQAANVVPWIGDQIFPSPLCQHHLTVKVPCPKELIYQTATGSVPSVNQQPTNFFPFFCFGYNQPNELTVPVAGELDYRVAISWTSHFVYEDE